MRPSSPIIAIGDHNQRPQQFLDLLDSTLKAAEARGEPAPVAAAQTSALASAAAAPSASASASAAPTSAVPRSYDLFVPAAAFQSAVKPENFDVYEFVLVRASTTDTVRRSFLRTDAAPQGA